MPARCHNDSCSIAWSEVNTLSGPAYQADVLTDGDGVTNGKTAGQPTIQCGDDGLEVIINQVDTNILQSSPYGLLAILPVSNVITLSGNPDNKNVGPGADAASPQSSDTYDWTNGTGRDALVLVSGELNFDYGIVGHLHTRSYGAGTGQRAGRFADSAFYPGTQPPAGEEPTNSVTPFNAMVAMRVLAKIGAAPADTDSVKAVRVGIGGVMHVSDPDGAERKVERIPFMFMIRVPDGDQLFIKSQAFFQGPSQTMNIFASEAAGTNGNGLTDTGHELWNLQVAAIPI
jgi:hypothetical protein